MMVDGAFPPLDMMFSESDMLTIMRGAPVGRYLQPTGSWDDGLNTPFCYVRHEKYVKIGFGPLTAAASAEGGSATWNNVNEFELITRVCDSAGIPLATVGPQQELAFHRTHPFTESVTVVLPGEWEAELSFVLEVHLKQAVRGSLQGSCTQQLCVADAETILVLALEAPGEEEALFGVIEIRVEVTDSEDMGETDSPWLPERGRRTGEVPHPLCMHEGGKRTSYSYSTGCGREVTDSWDPAWGLQCQNYDRLYSHSAEAWTVPGPDGAVSDMGRPPVAKVTAIYGVNQNTPRCIFLRHRWNHHDGGKSDKVVSINLRALKAHEPFVILLCCRWRVGWCWTPMATWMGSW